jgi:hypothetical protein
MLNCRPNYGHHGQTLKSLSDEYNGCNGHVQIVDAYSITLSSLTLRFEFKWSSSCISGFMKMFNSCCPAPFLYMVNNLVLEV